MSAKPLTVFQRIELLIKQTGISKFDAQHHVMREVIAEIKQTEQQQIAAGTHATCPVCGTHAEVNKQKIANHNDNRAFFNFQSDVPHRCKGVGKTVRRG